MTALLITDHESPITPLRAAIADVTGDGCEIIHGAAEPVGTLRGRGQELADLVPGGLSADQRRVCQLPLRYIFSRGLAEGGGVLFQVKKIVDDLEGQADRLAVAAKHFNLFIIGAGQHSAKNDRGGEQLTGLV